MNEIQTQTLYKMKKHVFGQDQVITLGSGIGTSPFTLLNVECYNLPFITGIVQIDLSDYIERIFTIYENGSFGYKINDITNGTVLYKYLTSPTARIGYSAIEIFRLIYDIYIMWLESNRFLNLDLHVFDFIKLLNFDIDDDCGIYCSCTYYKSFCREYPAYFDFLFQLF